MFQSVSRNRRIASLTASRLKRNESHGLCAVSRYQRNASAPWRSRTVQGSMTLPLLLLIFWPSPSRMSPRHTTLRYAGPSNSSVLSASSE